MRRRKRRFPKKYLYITTLPVCLLLLVFLGAGHLKDTAAPAARVRTPAATPVSKPVPTPVPTQPPVTPEPKVVINDWNLLLVNADNPIDTGYEVDTTFYDSEAVDRRIYDPLVHLLQAAKENGLSLWVASGYRDAETQKTILENAVINRMTDYGMAESEARADALLTIALPGHSEHQSGLAVDFNYVNGDFVSTAEYAWLSEHAAGFGFVQRYPLGKEEITGIDAEPWHYRYVGPDHAAEMNRLGLCLEEYLDYLKTR